MEADDARARQTLLAMFERITLDPQAALGLTGSPEPAQVRAAFLAATKQFHPARFARMSPDVQKLANEVFLALRAAHDTLARLPSSVRSTGQLPTVRATSSQPLRPTGNLEAREPAAPTAHAVSRTPLASRNPAASGPRPAAPVRRSGIHAAVTPPTAPTAPRGPGGAATVAPATGGDELAPVLALLAQHQFAAARATLEKLAARAPQTTRYRALIAYANGREAQLAHRVDEARVELMDALQLDPGLQLAKVALAELFTRRK